MRNHGDFTPGKTVYVPFNTRTAAQAPATLAGTPAVSVYKRGSTAESTAGVTLTVDYDSRTGYHVAAIDTSADGTFYAAGNDFGVVLTAGTVDSVSVVGVEVGSFSLSNRSALRPATADRTLAVESDGMAHADVKEWLGTAPLALSSQQVQAVVPADTVVASVTGAVGSVTGNVGGNVTGSVGSISGVTFPSGFSTLTVAAIQSGLATASALAVVGSDVITNGTVLSLMAGGGFDTATDSLEAIRNRGDAAWTTATGFSTLDAAGVRAAVGLASADLDTQLGTIDGNVDAVLADTGTDGVVVAAGSKAGYSLAAAGLDAVTVETGLNARQALSVIAAASAGVLSGAATTEIQISAAGVSATNRVTATVDADGNRSSVTLSLPS